MEEDSFHFLFRQRYPDGCGIALASLPSPSGPAAGVNEASAPPPLPAPAPEEASAPEDQNKNNNDDQCFCGHEARIPAPDHFRDGVFTPSRIMPDRRRMAVMKPASSSSFPSSSQVPLDRPTAPGPVPGDEDIASDLVDRGIRIAEGELRDAVTERYVDEAYAGEETDEALDDIDRAEAAADLADEVGPESDAIYREVPPED